MNFKNLSLLKSTTWLYSAELKRSNVKLSSLWINHLNGLTFDKWLRWYLISVFWASIDYLLFCIHSILSTFLLFILYLNQLNLYLQSNQIIWKLNECVHKLTKSSKSFGNCGTVIFAHRSKLFNWIRFFCTQIFVRYEISMPLNAIRFTDLQKVIGSLLRWMENWK